MAAHLAAHWERAKAMPHPPIYQQVSFLYTRDLAATAHFYEETLGLTLALDQGDCRIYHVSRDGFLGFCQREEAPDHPAGVILTLVTLARCRASTAAGVALALKVTTSGVDPSVPPSKVPMAVPP